MFSHLIFSVVLLASLSFVSCGLLDTLRQPSSRQDEFQDNQLTLRQGVISFPFQGEEDAAQIPGEDPNMRVVRPAGGEVVRGGSGIMGIMLTQGVAEPAKAAAATSTMAMHNVVVPNGNKQMVVAAAVTTLAAAGVTVPTPAATVAAAGSTLVPPIGSVPPPPSTMVTPPPTGNPSTGNPAAGNASTPLTTAGVSNPGGPIITVTTAGGTAVGATTAAYGSAYATSSAATVTVATTTAAYGSSYGSSSGSSYGSSSGSGSTSGTSSSSGSVNSIGVPYGYYTNTQYFPYASNAASQLTSPLIFSPYLPEPSYINKYFGLNLPLVQGRR